MQDREIYYKQSDIWGKNMEQYQFQVLQDILSMIPGDVESILDVGCGDGLITNVLPKDIKVVGMDISEEALKFVEREKVLGRITEIPFGDKSFDLVMANDLMEHIADADYQKAVDELKRVSKKYILITVPHAEDIESKKSKCADCGTLYHVNWHQRMYDSDYMKNMISNDNWKVNQIRYSGANTLPMIDPTTQFKHKLGFYYYWENSVCSNCGSKNKLRKDENTTLFKAANAARQEIWFSSFRDNVHIAKSEIIALYSVNDNEIVNELPVNETVSQALLCIDFSNKLQAVPEFIEGSGWPVYIRPLNSTIDEKGISLIKGDFMNIEIRLPIISSQDDSIEIKTAKNSQSPGRLALYSFDGISSNAGLIGETVISEDSVTEFSVNDIWTPDKFGSALNLYVYGDLTVHSLCYKKADLSCNTEFWKIKKGHNVFLLEKRPDYLTTFGFYSNQEGRIPKPRIKHLKKDNKHFDEIMGLVFNKIDDSMKFLFGKLNTFSTMLEEKEIQRANAEKAYAELEIQRAKAEQACANLELQLESELIKRRKVSSRRAQRVLVLSHMFPTAANPVGGSFIHEQVKALRENEEIDARVVSCQPFWLNGVNIPRILRANKVYHQEVLNAKWTNYNGVPVMYLPYRVGRPFFLFPLHAWSYRAAVMSKIESIWREFKFDLVHSHTAFLDGTTGLAISRKYNVPYVITEHTGPFTNLTNVPVVRQLTLNSIKNANRVWCVSDSLAEQVKSYFNDSRVLENIKVLNNGVSTQMFYPFKQENPKDHTTLAYVGFLEEVKNPINLIQAFSKVREAIPAVKLKIVGSGTLLNEVQEEITRLSLENSCELTGMKPRDEVADIIREECDILILPSKSETFGVVLIEALACGKPVVATRCGGPESIVKENFLGELCEKDNPEALARSILRVIDNLEAFDASKIRNYAVENFSFESICRHLEIQYQQI